MEDERMTDDTRYIPYICVGRAAEEILMRTVALDKLKFRALSTAQVAGGCRLARPKGVKNLGHNSDPIRI